MLLSLGFRVLSGPIDTFHWFGLHLFLRLTVAGILATCIFNISNRLYDAYFSFVSKRCPRLTSSIMTYSLL